MKRSDSICSGLRAFPWTETKRWKGEIDHYDPCILAGFTIVHRYARANQLKWVFHQTRRADLASKCKLGDGGAAVIEKFTNHGPGSSEIVFNEWKMYFDTFFRPTAASDLDPELV